jgi:hypothetical protein
MRRLPDGVEYTHIKTVFMDLPSALTTLLWSTTSQDDRLVATFKGRTLRAIHRALRREAETHRDPNEISAIRHELVSLCLHEAHGTSSPHPERRISVTHVVPELFDEAHRPTGPSAQHIRITVTDSPRRRHRSKRAAKAPTVLEERVIVSEPAAWDPSIPFIDPDVVDRPILELLHNHFPLMGIRVAARWRSNYSPEGWRLVTQHVVPQLYEYLRPFYPVRRYRRSGRTGSGQYPARLKRDITDIIRFELPMARRLTVARVTAAIQRHTAREYPTQKRTKGKKAKTVTSISSASFDLLGGEMSTRRVRRRQAASLPASSPESPPLVDAWIARPDNPPQRVADKRRHRMRLSALFDEFGQFLRVGKGGGRPQHRDVPVVFWRLFGICPRQGRRNGAYQPLHCRAVPSLSVRPQRSRTRHQHDPPALGYARELRQVGSSA